MQDFTQRTQKKSGVKSANNSGTTTSDLSFV